MNSTKTSNYLNRQVDSMFSIPLLERLLYRGVSAIDHRSRLRALEDKPPAQVQRGRIQKERMSVRCSGCNRIEVSMLCCELVSEWMGKIGRNENDRPGRWNLPYRPMFMGQN